MLYWEGKDQIKQNLSEVLSTSYGFVRKSIYSENGDFSSEFSNMLFFGDNLACMVYLLKHGFEEKFDLIYIDPPFYSENNFTVKKKF